MSFDPSKTISLPFTITFLNNFYTLLQITNGDYNATLPASDCPFFSHPTIVNFFDYDGHTFDYTKCTNIISVSRDAFFSAVLALAASGPISGTVIANQGTSPWVSSVSNFPVLQNINTAQIGGSTYSLGQKNAASSAPVVLASDQTPLTVSVNNFPGTTPISGTVTALQGTSPWVTSGTITASQGTSPWVSSISNFPVLQNVNESQIGGSAYSLGQKTSVNSAPVVIASDQSVLTVSVNNFPGTTPISGTVTALQGTSPWVTSGTITANQGTSPWVTSVGNFPATTAVTQSTTPWVVNETQIGGSAYSLGQKTSANSAPVVLSSDQSSVSVTVANFPATTVVSGTVTANQGGAPWSVNETQIGGGSYTLGQKVSASSAPVVISSDQSAITVNNSIPATADIIGASLTATGTLVTIPANRTFLGSLSLSCSITTAGSALPTIDAAGAGVVPTGVLLEIVAEGLALSLVANSNTISNVYIFGGSAGATITFTQAATGTSTGQIAGRLL